MKSFTMRSAQPEDAAHYTEWLQEASDINLVDYTVYSRPCINTVVVEADGNPVLMNSFQPVLVMEALAPQPGLAPKDEARALRKLYDGIRNVALASGIGEIWFQCADPSLEKFILKNGFIKANAPLFKMMLRGKSDPLNSPRPEGKSNHQMETTCL